MDADRARPSRIQETLRDVDVTLGATSLRAGRSPFVVWAPLAHMVQVPLG
jgi:hypothetical protein